MNASSLLKRLSLSLFALAVLVLSPSVQASIAYGSINNFDTVNDTGHTCHGFEIEIEDCRTTDITYTYNYNHYGVPRFEQDDTDPLHPKCRIRWESKKNPDGSWASYTAIPSGPIAPTNGHMFTNPSVNFGGEHFGVGYSKAVGLIKYNWLIDNGSGALIHGGAVQVRVEQAPRHAVGQAEGQGSVVLAEERLRHPLQGGIDGDGRHGHLPGGQHRLHGPPHRARVQRLVEGQEQAADLTSDEGRVVQVDVGQAGAQRLGHRRPAKAPHGHGDGQHPQHAHSRRFRRRHHAGQERHAGLIGPREQCGCDTRAHAEYSTGRARRIDVGRALAGKAFGQFVRHANFQIARIELAGGVIGFVVSSAEQTLLWRVLVGGGVGVAILRYHLFEVRVLLVDDAPINLQLLANPHDQNLMKRSLAWQL
mgnify:CR=1 FL=1